VPLPHSAATPFTTRAHARLPGPPAGAARPQPPRSRLSAAHLAAQDFWDAAPEAGGLWLALLAHEAAHLLAARRHGVGLYLPFFIPAGIGFLGSLGAITRLRGFAPDRAALLEIAAAGPAAGFAVSAALFTLGLGATALGLGANVEVDSGAFASSLLVASLSQLALGGGAFAGPTVAVNGLLLAGWAGLVVNALNSLPAGELDGARMALGLLGRRGATLLGLLTLGALGVGSFESPIAFYWVLYVLVLQRGPLLPCENELSAPPAGSLAANAAVAMMAGSLLVLAPFPVELAAAINAMADPVPF